jgi:hypothetical protein
MPDPQLDPYAAQDADGFAAAAAAKLWALLPALYRAEDTGQDSAGFDVPGPLRGLLNRIAVQAGEARRVLDRLWEDQSIETCDDWVIPYLAALLDTNLVPSMDARGQRLDVANTVYYRRRKGTVGLLEQLAADVTGWECRVVEFFRRLGRTRHLLDPEIGRPADRADPPGARRLQRAAQLTGLLTGTPAGGFADLRHPVGAADAPGPFDEYFHRADVRRGRGALGWYGVSKVGVFLWRGADLAVDRATPVPVAGCPDHYAVDPTGRQIGLWQADDRPAEGYGERWTPPAQWQVPGPLTQALYDAVRAEQATPPSENAYPDPDARFQPRSFAVRLLDDPDPLSEDMIRLWPEVGRFAVPSGTGQIEASYHYGLFSRIGAGPYDRRRIGVGPVPDPAPAAAVPSGPTLPVALTVLGQTGTLVVTDALTSTAVSPVGSAAAPIADVCVRAADAGRAVVRLDAADGAWVFTGSPAGTKPAARLRLEGLLFSGQDVVLAGGFAEVILTCCTFDPGTSGELRAPQTVWQPSVDGRDLVPTRLWIEGTVRTLTVDRCILGPVRTRLGGVLEGLCAADSTFQGLPADIGHELSPSAVFDPDGLFQLLRRRPDPLTAWLEGRLGPAAAAAVAAHTAGTAVPAGDLAAVVADLNAVLGQPLWDPARFAGRRIPPALVARATRVPPPAGPVLTAVNRELLEAAFPVELARAALASDDGVVCLSRCTVLGQAFVHRLECSESILDEAAYVVDAQEGCVRFSAWASGSVLPRRFESVEVAPHAPLFASRRFGEAGFAQLSDGADSAIVGASTAGPPSIRSGGHSGSEMGVFCRDGAAVKERSLLIKYQEYLPVGLTPVLIPVPPSDAEAEILRGRPWPPM